MQLRLLAEYRHILEPPFYDIYIFYIFWTDL